MENQRQKARKVRQKSDPRKKTKSRDVIKSVHLVEVIGTKAIGVEEIAVIIIVTAITAITPIVVTVAITRTTEEIAQVTEGPLKADQVAVACVLALHVPFTKLQLSLPALN